MLNCKLKNAVKGFKQKEFNLPDEGITPDETTKYEKARNVFEENNTKLLSELIFSINHET